MSLAIIGGTGLAKLADMLEEPAREIIDTPYGQAEIVSGKHKNYGIIFLARHGLAHTVAPHLINYRANIWSLKELGVDSIFASAAVGALSENIKPGDFVLPDQFIDFTKSRQNTFFNGVDNELKHVDMTEPYNGQLRMALAKAAEEKDIKLHPKGIYVCTEGPRFETPAEIEMFKKMGADVVGMTGVPEVVLAKELDIKYASLAITTNYAAGIADSELTFEECREEIKKWEAPIMEIFIKAAEIGGIL
jgi:5'-methylthioadenosine phosphorylase